MAILDCSDNGTDLTWQGAYSVTVGLADRNNYQYGCLGSPVNIPTFGRYGVSVDSAKLGDPIPVWGRVYSYTDGDTSCVLPQDMLPCGEHIGDVSKNIGVIN